MQKPTSKTSGPAEDDSSAPIVLDFLYHDSRRVGSFLAQFEQVGHLESVTRTKDGSRGKTETSESEAKGNLAVASGRYSGKTETRNQIDQGYSKTFDPYWANARDFLDHLNENNLIIKDINHASYGQFVEIRGWLSVLDLVMFKDAWKLPSIQKSIASSNEGEPPAAGNRQQRRSQGKPQSQSPGLSDEVAMMVDLMQILPHSIHATMMAEDGDNVVTVWGALREESLVTPASELTLTHGVNIPGEWIMIGMLNARPDISSLINAQMNNGSVNELPPGLVDSVVGRAVGALAPVVRFTLGRPASAFAVTPILIFRQTT